MVAAGFTSNHGRVGIKPYNKTGIVQDELVTVWWVGLDKVQAKTYNTAIQNKQYEEQTLEDGTKEKTSVTLPSNPALWGRLTYFAAEVSLTMPPLGESMSLPGSLFRALKGKLGRNLLTGEEGGEMVARFLKEQISEGVPLHQLSLGEDQMTIVKNARAVSDIPLEELEALVKARKSGEKNPKRGKKDVDVTTNTSSEALLDALKGDHDEGGNN